MTFREHKTQKQTKLIGFKIDSETEEKLIALAKEKQWALSHLVRNIVCEYVKNLK